MLLQGLSGEVYRLWSVDLNVMSCLGLCGEVYRLWSVDLNVMSC